MFMKYLLTILWVSLLSTSSAQTADSIVIKQVDSIIQVSRKLTGLKQYEQALTVNVEAERLAKASFGLESAVYGRCCFNRGRVFYFKGDNANAEKWYLDARSIYEKAGSKEHLDNANCLLNLGVLYHRMAQYKKAESVFIESLDIRKKIFGKEHPN